MNITEFYQQINPSFNKQLFLDICDIDDLDTQYDDALDVIKSFPEESKKSFELISITTPANLEELKTFKSSIHFLKNEANDFQFQNLFEVTKKLDVLCSQLIENQTIALPDNFHQYQQQIVPLYNKIIALIDNIH